MLLHSDRPANPPTPPSGPSLRRRLLALVAAGAAVTALAACGNDDTAGTPGTSSSITGGPMTSPPPESTGPAGPTGPTEPDVTTPPDTATKPTPDVTLPTSPGGTGPGSRPPAGSAAPPRQVETAIADLGRRLDVQPDAVTVVVNDAVDWNDGSVGCPKKGTLYPQVVTPGYRLILEVDGKEYAYHAARGQPFFYCATPDPGGTTGDGGMST